MATDYKKLSESDEISLNDLINAEDTYIAAFKTNEKNYKIPAEDFKIPEDTSKVYTFTAKRARTQGNPSLKIYDENNEEVDNINFLDELIQNKYTIQIKLLDDWTLPIYQKYIGTNAPVCIFALTNISKHGSEASNKYTFSYVDINSTDGNAVYTIIVQNPATGESFVSSNYFNTYSRTPESSITGVETIIGGEVLKFYPLANNGRNGLPAQISYRHVEESCFGLFEWDADFDADTNHLIIEPPSDEQVRLRSEFIIKLINGANLYSFVNATRQDPAWGVIPNPNVIELPSIHDGKKRSIRIFTINNNCPSDTPENFTLFKITAIGKGWEFTPLFNCEKWETAYPGIWALYYARIGD